ncbi:MAG: hypothetical protein ACYTG5_11680 [Planctomycetota bacterium]
MRSTLVLVAALATSAALSAQAISIRPSPMPVPEPSGLVTVSRAGVFAGREVRSLPAATPILRPTELAVEAPGARASLQLAPIAEPGVSGARFGWAGHATILPDPSINLPHAGTTGNGSPEPTPQHYRLLLRPRDTQEGTLVIAFKGVRANRANATAVVSIGDRQIKFEAEDRPGDGKRITIEGFEVGPLGLPVGITLEGFARGGVVSNAGALVGSGFEAGLSVRFEARVPPKTCELSPGQRSCPQGGVLKGAILSDSLSSLAAPRDTLVLSLEGALPGAIGVTLLNRSGEFVRIPFTDCPLLMNPVVRTVFHTDEHGNARTAIPVPSVPGDLQFFVQQVTVKFGGDRGLQIASSNSLQVNCSR